MITKIIELMSLIILITFLPKFEFLGWIDKLKLRSIMNTLIFPKSLITS